MSAPTIPLPLIDESPAESTAAAPALQSAGVPGYWRSLEELRQTPEFLAHARQEFPGFTNLYEGLGEAEVPGALSRRQFLALSAAALALSGVGCFRRPDLQILPYSQQPENVSPGLPTFYATTIDLPQGPLPVLVESHEGRPTKIEGNPSHPLSGGKTNAQAQATILDLYSPDRIRAPREKGNPSSWEAFDRFAAAHFKKLAEGQGKGLFVLTPPVESPSVQELKAAFAGGATAQARWLTAAAIDRAGCLSALREALGVTSGGVVQRLHFEKAKRILVLDADPLGQDCDSIANTRGFTGLRRAPDDAQRGQWECNRLYVVEPCYTVTGTMADHRLRLSAREIFDYLIALARVLVGKLPAANPAVREAILKLPVPQLTIDTRWLQEVAQDLLDHRGGSLIVLGHRQPPEAHLLAAWLNELLGNRGGTVTERASPLDPPTGLQPLVAALDAGEVQTLVILGGNPLLWAPASLKLAERLAKVPVVIYLNGQGDETAAAATWHLPGTHTLEEWGDREGRDGSHLLVQPLIAPLHGGRSPLELLLQITRAASGESFAQVQAQVVPLLQKTLQARAGGVGWAQAIQSGHAGVAPAPAKPLPLDAAKTASLLAGVRLAAPLEASQFEFAFAASPSVDDGRYAWNAWLMELPDPLTKLVWDNAALISPATARTLGVAKNGELLALRGAGGQALEIPAFILPGTADRSITLPVGFGNLRIAHAPGGGGFNVYPLRDAEHPHWTAGTVQRMPRGYPLVTTQEWGVIPEGRDEIIHAATVQDYTHGHDHEHGHEHDHGHGHAAHPDPKESFQAGYARAMDKPRPERARQDLSQPAPLEGHHQWGMVVDLNTCTGCSACMVACQGENNIPVVGKGEVGRNREMHWIRLDRYFSGSGVVEKGLEAQPADDPSVVHQPMMCQHCEGAPCESVCPVNATVHSPEGLNLQVYNRCIGTRYCGNNCPYKVRRFNWFDFNQRQLDEVRIPTPFSEKGTAETLKMQKNPDVTPRSRGVMEKCTYCIQRIERGKLGAKLRAIQSRYAVPADPAAAGYDVRQEEGVPKVYVPDGVITPACAQACPSSAIVFGNVADRTSRAFRLKQREADYLVLGSKNTRPRTSYLPRLRNPNPKMEGRA